MVKRGKRASQRGRPGHGSACGAPPCERIGARMLRVEADSEPTRSRPFLARHSGWTGLLLAIVLTEILGHKSSLARAHEATAEGLPHWAERLLTRVALAQQPEPGRLRDRFPPIAVDGRRLASAGSGSSWI
jgi:hypothetical protein